MLSSENSRKEAMPKLNLMGIVLKYNALHLARKISGQNV